MVRLDRQYRDKGLVVLGFPCNQFGRQEPASEAEILSFVEKKFDVKFPMFSKINVKGPATHPVYKFLLDCFPGDVSWNFAAKFLVDRNGVPVARFAKEDWATIEKALVEALDEAPTPSSKL